MEGTLKTLFIEFQNACYGMHMATSIYKPFPVTFSPMNNFTETFFFTNLFSQYWFSSKPYCPSSFHSNNSFLQVCYCGNLKIFISKFTVKIYISFFPPYYLLNMSNIFNIITSCRGERKLYHKEYMKVSEQQLQEVRGMV